MDRFSSREDPPEWDSTAWRDGHCARMAGKPQVIPNAFPGGFRRRSWVAGWTDADASIQADRESAILEAEQTDAALLDGNDA